MHLHRLLTLCCTAFYPRQCRGNSTSSDFLFFWGFIISGIRVGMQQEYSLHPWSRGMGRCFNCRCGDADTSGPFQRAACVQDNCLSEMLPLHANDFYNVCYVPKSQTLLTWKSSTELQVTVSAINRLISESSRGQIQRSNLNLSRKHKFGDMHVSFHIDNSKYWEWRDG